MCLWISGEVIRLPKGASLPVTLKVLEYELYHFCPLKVGLLTNLFRYIRFPLCIHWNRNITPFHQSIVQEITANISFAPIGLLNMFNSGGVVEQIEVHLASDKKPEHFDGEVHSELSTSLSRNRSPTATISLKARGCGRFGSYSSQVPLKCKVGNNEVDFEYEPATGLLTFVIPVPEEEMYKWLIEIQV